LLAEPADEAAALTDRAPPRCVRLRRQRTHDREDIPGRVAGRRRSCIAHTGSYCALLRRHPIVRTYRPSATYGTRGPRHAWLARHPHWDPARSGWPQRWRRCPVADRRHHQGAPCRRRSARYRAAAPLVRAFDRKGKGYSHWQPASQRGTAPTGPHGDRRQGVGRDDRCDTAGRRGRFQWPL
jgi:hypothetical protein